VSVVESEKESLRITLRGKKNLNSEIVEILRK